MATPVAQEGLWALLLEQHSLPTMTTKETNGTALPLSLL